MTVPNPGMLPANPGGGPAQARTGAGRNPTDPNQPPETVRYLLFAWAVMLGGELIHQLFSIAMAFLNPSALMESAREANKTVGGDAVPNDQISLIVYASITLMGLFMLAFVLLLAAALNAVARQKKWADNAVRLLMVFSAFFVLRMITVFLVVGASTNEIPTAVVALDGVIQIITGVAAICGLIFASQDEAKKWSAKQDAKGGRGNHNDSSPVA
ncbi:hypothetical protein QYQ98_07030 [Corynebacterium sp. P3-F1]|uniref:hypothetical protein n=1 Tax=Corynebacterium sp. P3-F1 TaxID=3059080 RepID=UPI00265D527D|nr:hypothetical protein [Corynebacterium sp. P3-F1]WKK60792.1 hypothetical protein QYQ98_07030 [Corynebacterium sp. P3-F1]